MPVRTRRPRVAPVWTFALRKGPYRAEMTRYLARNPEALEYYRRMDELLWGGEIDSDAVPRVREPFDARRRR